MKLLLLFFVTVLMLDPVWAGDLEDGLAAFGKEQHGLALKKFKQAAAKGNVKALFHVGYAYDQGAGVYQNFDEAAKWYRLAVAKGVAEAQFYLGYMHVAGRVGEIDGVEAFRLYKLSAAQGYKQAQHAVGGMYANGYGGVKDLVRAQMWLILAADGYPVSNEDRERVAKIMTSQEMIEAQKMARDCQERSFKECD